MQREQKFFQEATRCCAHSGLGDARFAINIGPGLPAVYNYSGPGRGKPNLCRCRRRAARTRGAASRGAGLPRGAEACRGGPGLGDGSPPDRRTDRQTPTDRQAGSCESHFPAGSRHKSVSRSLFLLSLFSPSSFLLFFFFKVFEAFWIFLGFFSFLLQAC